MQRSTQIPANRRVLVTRAAHQAGKLSEGLRNLGTEPVEVPVLEIHPPEDFRALDSALGALSTYDWLLFTSANSVRSLAERAVELGLGFAVPESARVAAVGESTAEALRALNLLVSFVPKEFVAESLVAGLSVYWPGKRVLLARAAAGHGVQPSDVIPNALRSAGAGVDVVDAYRNVLPEEAPALLRLALASPIDAVTFASSSSVTHFAEAAARAHIPFPLARIPAVSIGPITSQTLREHNWPPSAEADPHDIPGLIAAVAGLLAH